MEDKQALWERYVESQREYQKLMDKLRDHVKWMDLEAQRLQGRLYTK